jgi:hypothetical protein
LIVVVPAAGPSFSGAGAEIVAAVDCLEAPHFAPGLWDGPDWEVLWLYIHRLRSAPRSAMAR